MEEERKNRRRILIADDSEMNREILTDILCDEYDILEAENGEQAIAMLKTQRAQIDMMLLDYVMPVMNGFEVLEEMTRQHWIEDVPVIMISAESSMTYVERAYELGVTDFIKRPFEALVIQKRVANTMLLYAKQKALTDMVVQQICEKERQSGLMIEILSHIVEFRNGESGLHVLHIHTLTDLILRRLMTLYEDYTFRPADVERIATASALHDIGKIAIPEEILNKPGRLTREEFAVMKTHTTLGATMLEQMASYPDEPLVRTAYEICRWHHERYDGRGYPDGLKGDDIPISAQVVAMADVYDALTSERVYKKAFSHEVAVDMILGGECGTFNPKLLECLKDLSPTLQEDVHRAAGDALSEERLMRIVEETRRRVADSITLITSSN